MMEQVEFRRQGGHLVHHLRSIRGCERAKLPSSSFWRKLMSEEKTPTLLAPHEQYLVGLESMRRYCPLRGRTSFCSTQSAFVVVLRSQKQE
jgi:hypothetical protein